MKPLAVLCPIIILAASCLAAPPGKASDLPVDGTRAEALEAHTRFLAHDLLEGRDPGTRGYDIAAEYVRAQFRGIGLQPGLGQSYLQPVPLRRRELLHGQLAIDLTGPGGRRSLVNGIDVAIDASPYEEDEHWEADLVFVGWGIDAPALGFTDFEGLDVRGKAVVLLEGAPATLPGALRAHYSWTRTKEEMAARHGAVAVITVKTPEREKHASWERTRIYKPLPAMSWIHADGRPSNPVRATMTLSPDVAADVFQTAGEDLRRILRTCELGPVRGFELPQRVKVRRRSEHSMHMSSNVIGILPGTDPVLADEHVLVLAHLDHVGIGPPVDGDSIYNGAVDNAGGVAVMLEVARAMAHGGGPRRTVVFVATTAEEKGLLGAEYLAANPIAPAASIVAAVSVDGLMAFHDFTGIVALGADHSTLGAISEIAAGKLGATHVPDPIPGRGNLALSDQYPFLRRGIPVLFPNPARRTGSDDPERTGAWDDYEQNHYHKPSDELGLPLDWNVAQRWGDYILWTLEGLAAADQRPTWHEGDPLADVFAPGQPRSARSIGDPAAAGGD